MGEEQKYMLDNGEPVGLILTKGKWDKFIHELWFQYVCECGSKGVEPISKDEFVKDYKLIPIKRRKMRVKIFVPGQEPKIAEYDSDNFFSDEVLFEGVSEFVDMSYDGEKSFYSTEFKALFEKYRDVRIVNLDYKISPVSQILEC